MYTFFSGCVGKLPIRWWERRLRGSGSRSSACSGPELTFYPALRIPDESSRYLIFAYPTTTTTLPNPRHRLFRIRNPDLCRIQIRTKKSTFMHSSSNSNKSRVNQNLNSTGGGSVNNSGTAGNASSSNPNSNSTNRVSFDVPTPTPPSLGARRASYDPVSKRYQQSLSLGPLPSPSITALPSGQRSVPVEQGYAAFLAEDDGTPNEGERSGLGGSSSSSGTSSGAGGGIGKGMYIGGGLGASWGSTVWNGGNSSSGGGSTTEEGSLSRSVGTDTGSYGGGSASGAAGGLVAGSSPDQYLSPNPGDGSWSGSASTANTSATAGSRPTSWPKELVNEEGRGDFALDPSASPSRSRRSSVEVSWCLVSNIVTVTWFALADPLLANSRKRLTERRPSYLVRHPLRLSLRLSTSGGRASKRKGSKNHTDWGSPWVGPIQAAVEEDRLHDTTRTSPVDATSAAVPCLRWPAIPPGAPLIFPRRITPVLIPMRWSPRLQCRSPFRTRRTTTLIPPGRFRHLTTAVRGHRPRLWGFSPTRQMQGTTRTAVVVAHPTCCMR